MSLLSFHLLAKYTLVIHIFMPMGNHLQLDRISTYTFSGIHAKSDCLKERDAALRTRVEAGDKLTVGECIKQ